MTPKQTYVRSDVTNETEKHTTFIEPYVTLHTAYNDAFKPGGYACPMAEYKGPTSNGTIQHPSSRQTTAPHTRTNFTMVS